MPGRISASDENGRIPTETVPGALTLATGWTHRYKALMPGDPLHAAFAHWWRVQHTWDLETHYAFWLVGLHTWPLSPGNPRLSAARGAWFAGMRRFGYDDEALAESLGYPLASLRKRDVLRVANELEQWQTTTPVEDRRHVRAPLIVAEGEDCPQDLEMWWDPRLARSAPAAFEPVTVTAPPRRAA